MYLPDIFTDFQNNYPEILEAYHQVGEMCSKSGPLDQKTLHLIQLGVAIGTASRGGVRSHVRRALEAGAGSEEIFQTVLISGTIVGFPAMIASYGWAKEVLEAED